MSTNASRATETVAVLGGTFDPVHLGHLELAECARDGLGLARALLVPTGVPPHKPAADLAPEGDREAMVRLALQGRPGLELCELELGTEAPCYTLSTLRALRDGRPGLRPVFVMGMDALQQIPSWRDYQALLAEFDLAVVGRPGRLLTDVRERLESEIVERLVAVGGTGDPDELARIDPGLGGRILHLPHLPLAVSSSAIRGRAAAGLPLDGLVPPEVAGYIHRTGLYRQETNR